MARFKARVLGLVTVIALAVGLASLAFWQGHPLTAQAAEENSIYIVQSGDSLVAIAHKLGVSTSALAAANGLKVNETLFRMQKLAVPSTDASSESSEMPMRDVWSPSTATPAEEKPKEASANATGRATEEATPEPSEEAIAVAAPAATRASITYKVKEGESIVSIAKKHHISAAALAAANHLSPQSLLYRNMILIIPRGGAIAPAAAPMSEATAKPTEEMTKEATKEATEEPTEEASAEATAEATEEATEEATPESTAEATTEATAEATEVATAEATPIPSEEATITATETVTATASETATTEATAEVTAEATEEATPTPSEEATITATETVTATAPETATTVATAEATVEATPTPSEEATITATETVTATASETATTEATPTPSEEATITATETVTATASETATTEATPAPSEEATVTATETTTATTSTEGATEEPTAGATETATVGSTAEPTATATVTATEVVTPEANLLDTLTQMGEFKTFLSALAAAGLTDTLTTEGPFTLFAPNDAAFEALPAGAVDGLLATPPDDLAQILLYHLVPGEVLSSDLTDGTIIVTAQGGTVAITKTPDGIKVNNAKIIQSDIKTTNGVIHIIDAILLPSASTASVPRGTAPPKLEAASPNAASVIIVPVKITDMTAAARLWPKPADSIALYSPVAGGGYHSPIVVRGLSKTFEGTIAVTLVSDDGTLLAQRMTLGGADNYAFFQTDVRFNVNDVTAATLHVLEIDMAEGSILNSVDRKIALLPGQRVIDVTSPVVGQAVCNPIMVSGYSSTFEGNVVLTLSDLNSGVLVQIPAMGGSMGSYRDFATPLSYKVNDATPLLLSVAETDASGRFPTIDNTITPVTLYPAISSVCY